MTASEKSSGFFATLKRIGNTEIGGKRSKKKAEPEASKPKKTAKAAPVTTATAKEAPAKEKASKGAAAGAAAAAAPEAAAIAAEKSAAKKAKRAAPKMPQVKAPAALAGITLPPAAANLVKDLRDRHLLGVAIALVVAIFAVPLLLSKSGSSSSPQTEPAAAAGVAVSPPQTEAAVVAGTEGIRDYKKRLRHLKAKDPFKQQYASSNSGSGDAGGTDAGSSGAPAGTPAPGQVTRHLTLFHYGADVQISVKGGNKHKYKDIPGFTSLPSITKPVVVFMQVARSAKGRQATFLVSSDVSKIAGAGLCVHRGAFCELYALGKGDAANFTYGPNDKTYRVKVNDIRLIKKKIK